VIVAGTGHRPDKLDGYGDERAAKNLLVLIRQALLDLDPTEVISGMAQGFDQALAIAATQLDIPLTAAVPFRGQETRWSDDAQELYRRLLKKARVVVYVSKGDYSVRKMHIRNEWMVRRCDKLLALYDGSSLGGTANCVFFAERIDKPVVNLWDQWLLLRELV
jgi:uncharacterized phage-like protein YoqJ